MRQVGLDLGMKYCDGGDCESSAHVNKADNVFRDYGYSQAYWRLVGVHKVLKNKMWKNLDSGYPIQFRIKSHSIVCDGYGYQISNGDHLFHFNWGHTDSDNEFKKLWVNISNLDGNDFYKGAVLDIYPSDNKARNCKVGETIDWSNIFQAYVLFNNYIDKAEVSYITPATLITGGDIPYSLDVDNMINVRTYHPEYYIVYPDENYTYKATKSIILRENFQVLRGGVFRAVIDKCTSCPNGSQSAPQATSQDSNFYFSEDSAKQIQTEAEDNYIFVFPNPNKGIFTISASTDMENIKVLDLTGHIVYQDNPTQSRQVQIDLSNVAQGIYIVYVECKNKTFTEKLVIQ